MCAESYQFRVSESVLVSAVVAKIKAMDLDVGPNAEMDYRIQDGDGAGTFSIITDQSTQEGLITVHKVLHTVHKILHTVKVSVLCRMISSVVG